MTVGSIGLVVLGIGAAGTAASAPGSAPSAVEALSASPAPAMLPVATFEVSSADSYPVERELTGTLEARRSTEAAFERGGMLVRILVDEGERVAAGAPLAELDTAALAARRRELVARRRGAAALLEEMTRGPREEQIAAAEAEVERLRQELALGRIKRDRREKLLAERVVTAEERDEAAFGEGARAAALRAAQARLLELRNGTRPEQVERQKALLAELDAAIAGVDVDLRKSVLRAPFAATASVRFIDEGTIVAAGAPVLRLVDEGSLQARIGVPVDLAAELAPGETQQVIVAGRAHPARVAARLPEIDAATRTQVVILRFDADAAGAGLLAGQVARLRVTHQVRERGFFMPTDGLVRGVRGLWAAYALAPAPDRPDAWVVERRDVEVLHTAGDRVFVRGTLRAGDRVVAGGTHRVVPGQQVVAAASAVAPAIEGE